MMLTIEPLDVDKDPVVIEETIPPEPRAIGLPRTLAKLSEADRQQFIVEALRNKPERVAA
jgi:hypothetical protein